MTSLRSRSYPALPWGSVESTFSKSQQEVDAIPGLPGPKVDSHDRSDRLCLALQAQNEVANAIRVLNKQLVINVLNDLIETLSDPTSPVEQSSPENASVDSPPAFL